MIKRLIEKRVCFVWESLKESYSPKKETYVVLNHIYNEENKLAELMNSWTKAPKQLELLLSYLHIVKTEGEVTRAALLKKSRASDAQLKGLVEKNILWLEKERLTGFGIFPQISMSILILRKHNRMHTHGYRNCSARKMFACFMALRRVVKPWCISS